LIKILKFFDADPDPGCGIFLTLDPGSGIEKFGSRIWDEHPGSATLALRRPFVFTAIVFHGSFATRQVDFHSCLHRYYGFATYKIGKY
jgi:hypothetical protein